MIITIVMGGMMLVFKMRRIEKGALDVLLLGNV
jgi:hypothetical protein